VSQDLHEAAVCSSILHEAALCPMIYMKQHCAPLFYMKQQCVPGFTWSSIVSQDFLDSRNIWRYQRCNQNP
jgi:hypothetical protein